MTAQSKINEYLQSLKSSERLGSQVVFQTVLPANPPRWYTGRLQWPDVVKKALKSLGIQQLYQHQGQSIDLVRRGRHVIVATPTASGKTLIYNLPVLTRILAEPDSKNLYLFPLKALAQDQLRVFEQLSAHFGSPAPSAAIYDGDTSTYRRRRIRQTPPNVLLTNPEMLHLSLLAHHRKWAAFYADLKTVVVDEVHTYRGVMGSHLAQIFRRFHRICRYYGSSPTFVFSSATVANPSQLVEQLTGLQARAITQSGAARGRRFVVFLNPATGPAYAAIEMIKAALHRSLRTIVYTQSRKLTELIALWARRGSGKFADRISAYRAGFMPEERRHIEARLANGELLAVISTSALELGIDIGDLDLCLLVGYPGSMVSTWQRSGRVGRSGQDAALILIAGEDALDQFFMHNPGDFIHRTPEAAVVNPDNPRIVEQHLVCAAAELPLRADDSLLQSKQALRIVERLEKKGELLRSADGSMLYARRKAPHRRIDIRAAGRRFKIINGATDEILGEIDVLRAFRETHPGAVYLHKSVAYIVDSLDVDTALVKVRRADVAYYTRVRALKQIQILETGDQKQSGNLSAFIGRLEVTDQVTGYETWRIHTRKLINRIPLELPPQVFETEGLWFSIPPRIYQAVDARHLDFLGGIHAVEHAAIGIFPLLVMADRNDLGGIATAYHPQLAGAAIFIYDGVPGGAGLTRTAFERIPQLLENTYRAIQRCPCETGCPSCVHSPKCGSGNRPIDKQAAVFILEQLRKGSKDRQTGRPRPKSRPVRHTKKQRAAPRRRRAVEPVASTTAAGGKPAAEMRYGVFDLETQLSAAEVGGWQRAHLMKISCAVLYDSGEDAFIDFPENRIPAFIQRLQQLDLVVGFNIKRFDYQVLRGYSDFNFETVASLDILEDVYRHLGFRLSLAHLARVTLGAAKSGDGLQALRWWKQGRLQEIIAYCRQDVRLTRELYLYGKKNGYLLFENRAGNTARIPVSW